MTSQLRARWVVALALALALLGGCASLPPGADQPKVATYALEHPQETRLGQQFATAALAHGGTSGFRIISVGADGFLTRMQMIIAAQRTLDLQYFIFRGDETGRLLTGAVLHAADRGVRVRLLLDDGESLSGDEQVEVLEAHPNIEIRMFNPFVYRGHFALFKATEYFFNASRLDYRMHNKLMVVDNAAALMGGRNVGDEYFQIDPQGQFADDDVFVAGPMAQKLSGTFDEFWNSDLAIPIGALASDKPTRAQLDAARARLTEERQQMKADGVDYVKRVASGEPFNGMVSGTLPLTWAPAQLVYDTPDKKKVESGAMVGRLMHRPVANVAAAVQSELLMISAYLIPGDEGMQIFNTLRQHNVRVRILTNSLESTTVVLAHAGYMHYRVPLLVSGVELFEVRSLLGNSRGSGQTPAISRFGTYSLHGKLFVFDRQRVFVGSMNFDQRSMHLNTEIGLIIDSPELAQQVARRFEAMVQPENSYAVALRKPETGQPKDALEWRTSEGGQAKVYDEEPARSSWRRFEAHALSLVAPDSEL